MFNKLLQINQNYFMIIFIILLKIKFHINSVDLFKKINKNKYVKKNDSELYPRPFILKLVYLQPTYWQNTTKNTNK